jgi:hypothetical protein
VADGDPLALHDPLSPGGVPLQYRLSPGQPLPEDWSPQERYLYNHHLNNFRQGGVRHDDGSISTYLGIGVDLNGRYYMLPTVWDNQIVEPEEGIRRAIAGGLDKFPSYRNEEEGERRYQELHDLMERDMINADR